VPPYYETRAYVARIVRDFNKKKIAAAAAKKSAAVKKTDSKVHGAAVTHGSSAQIQASE
jgi:hypothetical protein